jgi:hypothetical protein
VPNPAFITNFDPSGKILLDRNRTAMDKDSSFKEDRYLDSNLTFIFLLLVIRISSHSFTKCEKLGELPANSVEPESLFISTIFD